MKNLDTVYTDASCYESLMRFPTDVKLLWECVRESIQDDVRYQFSAL